MPAGVGLLGSRPCCVSFDHFRLVSPGLSAQTPDETLPRRWSLPETPDIYSVEATGRIVEAARRCIEEDDPALVYCTTNDDVFHHYASGDPKGERQIADVGARVAKIFADDPMHQIYLTGDHSMSQKTTIANMQHVCDETASKRSAWGRSRTATS